jgi:uncharacterized protein YdaT
MPWNPDRYPPAMRHLPAWVREKAIEIANALLDEGHDEGQSIQIGIAKAKEWAVHHGWDAAERDDSLLGLR